MRLPLALIALALAGCGDVKHEPVRVIAAEREPMRESAPPMPPPAAAVRKAPPPPSAPSPRRDERAPGFVLFDTPRQPPETTGNEAFRQAIQARAASAALGK